MIIDSTLLQQSSGDVVEYCKPSRDMPLVVTIGGGHGQAVVLKALRRLRCSINAIVATADDGGCSGKLRREYGMPAPGDLRRCISALAIDNDVARILEERIASNSAVRRCRGNLVLAKRYLQYGSLQMAADWVAAGTGCVGRVLPASEEPGTLVVCDKKLGVVEGQVNVERTVEFPLVATVIGARRPNPIAIQAIERADIIIMGPGSFYTSTISALVTGEVGATVCRSAARKLLVANLTNEGLCSNYRISDYVLVLSSHLTICSQGETTNVEVLRNSGCEYAVRREDGVVVHDASIATGDGARHCELQLACALGRILGLKERCVSETPVMLVTDELRENLRVELACVTDNLIG